MQCALTKEVMMQNVVGDYDDPSTVAEWTWVQGVASYAHVENGHGGVWEFVLNLANTFEDVPVRLAPVIEEARHAGVSYLLFHQGT